MNARKLVQITATLVTLTLLLLTSPQSTSGEGEFTALVGPLSLVGGEDVHSIPLGSTLVHFDNGIAEVRDQSNKLVLCAKDLESLQIDLPKETVSATHVIEVPSESHVTRKSDGRIEVYLNDVRILTVLDQGLMRDEDFNASNQRSLQASFATIDTLAMVRKVISHLLPKEPDRPNTRISSYFLDDYFGPQIEFAWDYDVDNVGYFRAEWEVPFSPSSPYSQTLIYIWNGIEPSDQTDVIQPVIRYRQSDGWKGIAYYGIDGYYFYSTPISADVGDEIWGTCWWDDQNQEWRVTVYNWDTYSSTYITTDDFSANQNTCLFLNIEGADGVSTDDQVPGCIWFNGMEIEDTDSQDIDVQWYGVVRDGWDDNLSNLGVTVYSDTSVVLTTANY